MNDMDYRKKGIGGTDISAIVGLNPWKNAVDVWLDKTGQAPDIEINEPMYWGTALEPAVGARYELEHDCKLVKPEPITHPQHDFILGTPDWFVDNQPIGVEGKTSGESQSSKWAAKELPEHYYIQAVWYMMLSDFRQPVERWDFAVLCGGNKYYEMTIDRDETVRALEKSLLNKGIEFWERYVATSTMPELDPAHPTAGETMKLIYPNSNETLLEVTNADLEILAALDELRQTTTDIKELEAKKARAQNIIKGFIGGNAGLTMDDGSKIYWKKSKGRTTIDYKKIMLDANVDSGIIESHTSVGEGSRVFKTYFKGESE